MMDSRVIEPLRPDRVSSAADMLTRAFSEDPFFTFMDPDPRSRGQNVRWYLGATAHACIALCGAYVTAGNVAGVALWVPRGRDFDEEIMRVTGLSERAQVFGPETEARYGVLGRAFGEAHQQIAPEPHHYLTILGVDPDYQGQGIGGALLRPVLAEADRDGIMCYLETTRSRNVPFYERHGFVVIDARNVEGVPFWTFRREPKSSKMSADSGIAWPARLRSILWRRNPNLDHLWTGNPSRHPPGRRSPGRPCAWSRSIQVAMATICG